MDAREARELIAAATRYRAHSFEEVPLHGEPLRYEPRASASCPECRCVWIGTKAGEVVRVDLAPAPRYREILYLDRGIRALAHVHGASLGAGTPADSLWVGTDGGDLLLLAGGRATSFHLHTWWDSDHRGPFGGRGFPRPAGGPRRKNHGVTAMLPLPTGDPGCLDLLVAIREPAVFALRLERGTLSLRARHDLPGWVRWLFATGPLADRTIVGVTRSGERIAWSLRALAEDPGREPTDCPPMALLPATVRPLSGPRGGFLVSAAEQVYLVQPHDADPVELPALRGRSEVLSIATASIPRWSGDGELDLVLLGHADGSVRIVEESSLASRRGPDRAGSPAGLSVDAGDSVLALEVLAAEEPEHAHVVCGLHDHSVRLFRTASERAMRERLERACRDLLPPGPADGLPGALAAFHDLRRSAEGDEVRAVLDYLLVDVLLPAWQSATRGRDAAIRDEAIRAAGRADPVVLRSISRRMRELGGTDADSIVALSMACLRAMPRRNSARWKEFVARHLEEVHACTRAIARSERSAEQSHLRHWGRFVRKYLLLGDTFSHKVPRLSGLVTENQRTDKPLDALIYLTRLQAQRYDIEWQAALDGEILRVVALRTTAVVTTTRGALLFFDIHSGRRLMIERPGGPPVGELAPTRRPDRIRAVASAVAQPDQGPVAVALSWAGEGGLDRLELPLTIFELVRAGDVMRLVEESNATAVSEAARGDVRALVGLDRSRAFAAGLDTGELALLRPRDGGGWEMRPFRAGGTGAAAPSGRPSIRAMSALQAPSDGVYLVAFGTEGGEVRFARVGVNGELLAHDSGGCPFVAPIQDLALAWRQGGGRRVTCYVGTASGHAVCLLVDGAEGRDPIPVEPLWRDVNLSGVVALRSWRSGDYEHPVLVVATQAGRLCLYERCHQGVNALRLTGSGNYRFEGMRFDRLILRHSIVSFDPVDGGRRFLAAGPGGRLLCGSLYATRESIPRADVPDPDRLYRQVVHEQLLFGADAGDEERLRICELIRIGDGAMRRYILRRRLERLDLDALHEEVDALLSGRSEDLDPESDEDRDRLKTAIKVLSAQILDRRPTDILRDHERGELDRRGPSTELVARACRTISTYLRERLVQDTPGVVRLRMAIPPALFRASVFRHLALDASGEIKYQLAGALTSCLRDDHSVLQVEALRAVAIALRNMGVLIEQAGANLGQELHERFFPRGLVGAEWLLELLLVNWSRCRQRSEPAHLGIGWSYVTGLLPLLRLFPGDALGLCERISARGMGVEVLELIARRLRSARLEGMRKLITHVAIVRDVARGPGLNRSQFIETYDRDVDAALAGLLADQPPGGDQALARQLLHAYRRLAVLWDVDDRQGLLDLPARLAALPPPPVMDGHLARLPGIADRLIAIAELETATQAHDLARLRGQLEIEQRSPPPLPEPVQLALTGVLERWADVVEPRTPRTGDRIGHYRLGNELRERRNGLVFPVTNDETKVLKHLRHPRSIQRRRQFQRDAELSQEFARRYPDFFVGVPEIGPHKDWFIMERCRIASEHFPALEGPGRAAAALQAGRELAGALRCLHAEGPVHGDLRPDNVFVAASGRFQLGDLCASPLDRSRSGAVRYAPAWLRRRVPGDTLQSVWHDLAALTWFLVWALTGEDFGPEIEEESGKRLAAQLHERGDVLGRTLAVMLGASPLTSAEAVERALVDRGPGASGPAPGLRGRGR